MYTNNLEVQQGVKILWEGTFREVAFKVGYVLGIDDNWSDAEERGKGITEQMIQDWLEEMSSQGKIEYIDPISFIQTFEAGLIPEIDHRIKKATDNEIRISSIPSMKFEDIVPEFVSSQPVQEPSKDCLIHKAVQLKFDATDSQERAIRILRAYEEPYAFIHQENGNWSCLHKNRSYSLFVDTQKHLGYCTCQDFQQRGLRTGMPCKHIYGYLLQDNKVKEATKEKHILKNQNEE